MKRKRAVVSDLDGTLLSSQRAISPKNRACLEALGEKGITRILATGRSLWSLRRVIMPQDPVDYVIFSTGAGMMDWRNQELFYSKNLDKSQIQHIYQYLESLPIDFMLQEQVPHTHYIHYRRSQGLADFEERLDFYRDFAQPLCPNSIVNLPSATQFLAVLRPDQEAEYLQIKETLMPLTVVRATSPLDNASLWIEIFAPQVNKGESLLQLLDRLGHDREDCMVIGNDFNDLDMLEKLQHAYVTANAPASLLQRFRVVADHDSDGFHDAVQDWLSRSLEG